MGITKGNTKETIYFLMQRSSWRDTASFRAQASAPWREGRWDCPHGSSLIMEISLRAHGSKSRSPNNSENSKNKYARY